MAGIDLQAIVKTFPNGVRAVDGVDLTIDDGEFMVLVGPSGCGKTTLLRCIAGLEDVSEGTILIGSRDVTDVNPKDRDIAMVFQNYALYPHMSVFENMAYGLKIKKLPKNEIRRRVDKAADILELSTLLARKPRELSGGQRQRVAMGRAIVREPQVFLFDEPLSNLDAKLRVQMRIEIKKVHQKVRTTTVYVTHDQVEAMTLAQRMIVMNAGRMEQFGTPDEVYARPATTFVAGFIGAPPMNLVSGRVREGRLELPSLMLDLPDGASPGHADTVLMGVRPEHLRLSEDGWPITVELVEVLGAERLLHSQLGGQALIVRTDDSTLHPQPGDVLKVRPHPGKVHWFDPAGGKRIG